MLRILAIALLLGLAACAGGDRIVLLPNEDGAPSTITVTNSGGSAVIDKPNGGVAVARPSSAPEPLSLSETEINKDWADALALQPPRPVVIRLYFVLDTTEMTPDSQARLPRLLDLIRQRPAPEVVISGHTDRSGDPKYNEELGLRRAEAVRRAIESIGVPPDLITVTSYGAGDPLVRTSRPYEPRNRRVEITVR
jgi:outer membrane protein OmpA-like peptidoglycan-associated protein